MTVYENTICVISNQPTHTHKHNPDQRVYILLLSSGRTDGSELLLSSSVKSLKSVNPKPMTYGTDPVEAPLGTSQIVVF